jgi:transcriptional regulator with XRE-family HTH domain
MAFRLFAPRKRPALPARPTTLLIDLPALGARLGRWRQASGWSQHEVAQHAGVDPLVISRLERGHKPRLEVESAARLARVCGWTLEELCGLGPEPDIPAPPPVYVPMHDGKPAWLRDDARVGVPYHRLVAQIVRWERQGATAQSVADSLTAWGIPVFWSAKRWTPSMVEALCRQWVPRDAQRRRAFLAREGQPEPPPWQTTDTPQSFGGDPAP